MTRVLFELIRVSTFVIWTIVGFIFWLPFLLRMVAFFTGAILVSASGDTDLSMAQAGLDRAVRFYPDGFAHIQESINTLIDGGVKERKNWNSKTDFWFPLLEHFAFAFVFWGVSFAAYISMHA